MMTAKTSTKDIARGEIQAELETSASTLSHHLDKLKNEDLVPVSLMLHAQQSHPAGEDRPDLQMRGEITMENIKEVVRGKYAEAALRVHTGGSSCCGAGPATECCDPITSNLYDQRQTAELPEAAVLASLGCGNPTALAELRSGRNRSGPRLRRRH